MNESTEYWLGDTENT